jgi:hypothetical protein
MPHEETPTERMRAFVKAAEPLMKYLASHHPHMSVIVTVNNAELVEGLMIHNTQKFIKD